MSLLLTLDIANPLFECFTIDIEQGYFILYKRNYLPALVSKAWSKRTFTVDKVRGAILNSFLICSSLESEDTLNNVCLYCFWHIIHLFLSYNGAIDRLTFRFGEEQHSSVIFKSEACFFILDSLSFNTLLQ